MQKNKDIYFSPHKDGKGLHIFLPYDTYLYFYRMSKAHYGKHTEAELDYAVQIEKIFFADRETQKSLLTDILPVDKDDIIFGARIIKKITTLETKMCFFSVRIGYENKLYVEANMNILSVSSTTEDRVVHTQPILFHYPIMIIEHWLGGEDENRKVPDNWIEELSNNIHYMFDKVKQHGLMHKIYFWLNLSQYLHPEFFWMYTENRDPIPPFMIYDEWGNDIELNIDEFDIAVSSAKYFLRMNQYDLVTIENVFSNDVTGISREEVLDEESEEDESEDD